MGVLNPAKEVAEEIYETLFYCNPDDGINKATAIIEREREEAKTRIKKAAQAWLDENYIGIKEHVICLPCDLLSAINEIFELESTNAFS